MKRRIASGMLLTLLVLSSVAAQEKKDLLNTYLRNFEIAGVDVKLQVLQDAAARPEGLGPLFHQAVDFVINNGSMLPLDQRLRQMAVLASGQIRDLQYTEARNSLWRLFELDTETQVRVAALDALSVVARGQPALIRQVADWLDSQNQIYATGKRPDVAVVDACVKALGRLGDPVAFNAVFATMIAGLDDNVSSAARTALEGMQGSMAEHLKQVVVSRPLLQKRSALHVAVSSATLPDEQKGEVAETALATALGTIPTSAQERVLQREMRTEAAGTLRERKWSKATGLMIEHFNQTLLEFDRGITDKAVLLEALHGLGAMGNHDAAVRLTKYLVLLNSYAEKGQGTDEQVMLALLENLGRLGDKVAFDDLMYIQYLGYSARVKKTARQAQENVKW